MSTEGIMTMTVNAQPKNSILENFKAESLKRIEASPAWLAEARRNSWARFAEIGIPSTRHEEWKYFNLKTLTSLVLKPCSDTKLVNIKDIKEYLDEKDINVVFVNGVFSAEFSTLKNLPKGLTIETLSKSEKAGADEGREMLKRTTVNDPEPFVSLNTALHRDGVYIRIEDKAVLTDIIHIVHFTTDIKDTAVFPRTFIVTGRSVQASILESFIGLDNEVYFVNPVTDIHVGDNTVLNYYKAQADSPKAIHIGAVRTTQDANSQLEAFSLAIGSQMARNNISVASNGEGTDSILDGLYVLGGSQEVDNHTLIDHRQPNCTSHQLYKGILNDQSHAVFNGKIFVQPIAQKTNSYQLNKHLLLGKECRVDTKPQLEIAADDVKCTHGATIGQLNEDEVFYLQTRCIGKEDAVRMLSRGFVDDILDKLRDQNVRRKLSRLLSKKIAILTQ
ncbi:MAG: Fe-S cluster assembly protein SufD [Candidatus Omnitrophica bacterium]|nr:Fe-S cluster assembly protein SufD [Candidatus Omnitrophota bacterium]